MVKQAYIEEIKNEFSGKAQKLLLEQVENFYGL